LATATTELTATSEPTTAEKISKLPWSIASNSANTVFAQFTYFGSVFVLFLNELGLDKGQIGGLLSLFPYTGLIALFIAPWVARFGYKRTYLIFFGTRKVVTAFLLLTPWVLATYGQQVMFLYVSMIVLLFALCRSTAETGIYPWMQEYIPNSVRGKYSAANNVYASVIGFLSVLIAGFVIERSIGLNGFMLLIGVGVLFGLISVWAASHIPGGAPVKAGTAGAAWHQLIKAVRDKDFLFYIFGVSLYTLGTNPVNGFLPLFFEEEAGISSGNVILIQTGTLLGGLLSTYLWGWAADRYGSRPVMLSGILLRLLLPITLMAMPRNSPISLYVALGIVLLQGIADMGWAIGATRLLFVSVVPPAEKTQYMAVYYAWVGVIGGTSQLLGGQIVEASSGLSGELLFFRIDPYTWLFILGLILPGLSILLLRAVRSDTGMTVEQFAGMFLRGNPFLAMTSLVGYQLAKDEREVVEIAERLGGTKSPLTVEELLELLADPRFQVRFEAIISIARMRPDPRLTEALIQILNGTELALSTIAAWALGRIGDPKAQDALRGGLDSPYHSIKAHSARALGALGDARTIPLLLQRLEQETDKGLQMAYAAALGRLQARESAGKLFSILESFENEGARMELALSLARMVGHEGHFIRLVREARADFGTTTAQAVTALKKKVGRDFSQQDELLALLTECADALARNELSRGALLLTRLIQQLPAEKFDEASWLILQECARCLAEFEAERREYLLLALHTMDVDWRS
jgi:HEAT repeat protein/Na+/melibiose symporter-like transporter